MAWTADEPVIFKDYSNWKALGVSSLAFMVGMSIFDLPLVVEYFEDVGGHDKPYILKALGYHPMSNSPINMFLTYLLTTNLALVLMLPMSMCSPVSYKVAVRALNLGLLFGLGWMLLPSDSVLHYFAYMACAVSFFHWSEFAFLCFTKPSHGVRLDGYELYHSLEYQVLLMSGIVELYVGYIQWPNKFTYDLGNIPLGLIMSGELLRKLSMLNLRDSFSHDLSPVRGGELVTSGLYTLIRHPYYLGWFLWLLGLQLQMHNPLTFIMVCVVFWNYLDERICEEEYQMAIVYSQKFADYQLKVPLTGMPFISGFKSLRK